MNEFIRQTILVAIIVLIIALTTVGVAISNDNTKIDFPPRMIVVLIIGYMPVT